MSTKLQIFQMAQMIIASSVLTLSPAGALRAETMELMHFWNSDSEEQAIGTLVDAYSDNATFWLEDVADGFVEMQDQVLLRLSEGYPPTAFLWNAGSWGQFYDAGALELLSDLVPSDTLSAINPSLRSYIERDGATVALPVTAHGMNWTYYNASIMKKHGFGAPDDWDIFFDQMATIEEAGDITIASGGGMWEHQIAFDTFILSHGGRDLLLATRTGVMEDAFTSKTAIRFARCHPVYAALAKVRTAGPILGRGKSRRGERRGNCPGHGGLGKRRNGLKRLFTRNGFLV